MGTAPWGKGRKGGVKNGRCERRSVKRKEGVVSEGGVRGGYMGGAREV
jgi:hypothetical protein